MCTRQIGCTIIIEWRLKNILEGMDKQKKIVISHPTGNANTRGAVNGFYQGEALESFHTCIACFKGGLLYLLSSFPFLKDTRRQSYFARIKNY